MIIKSSTILPQCLIVTIIPFHAPVLYIFLCCVVLSRNPALYPIASIQNLDASENKSKKKKKKVYTATKMEEKQETQRKDSE
jgi:hypothetical protein